MSIYLFPHCAVPKIVWDKIPSSFFPITICKPWYMHSEERDGVNVILPDERLKPPDGFLELIKEYKGWVQDQGKGNALFAIFQQNFPTQEEGLRHIKTLIKGVKGVKEEIAEDLKASISWHLILHLATELELNQYDVDQALKAMEKESSPLLGIAEGASQSLEYLFKDVPDSIDNPLLDETIIIEVIKAWIELFGNHVDKDSIFLTFNKSLFYFLKSRFEESITKDVITKVEIPVKEKRVEKTNLLEISFPESIQKTDLISSFLSGKKLICIL